VELAGILYMSKVCEDLIYFQIAFCFSSVNHMFPFPSSFTAQTCEKSIGFARGFQIGIMISLSIMLRSVLNAPRVPFFVDTYHILALSTATPNGISQFSGSLYSLTNSFECGDVLDPQNKD
jgi:hypothetical protein